MHAGMPCVCCRTRSAPPPSTYTCPSRLPIKTLHREHSVPSIPNSRLRGSPQKTHRLTTAAGEPGRSGWVRAGLYKKEEHSAEALSVVQVHHSVWHLLGFSAWLGSRRSRWSVSGSFLFFCHQRAAGRPLEPPQLFPPCRRTSHHINRHDHQTGQADTWILPPPPEASCRRGADAATGPRRQPDSHDAGHHGPEFVLLQCQTDDGEGPGPACTLNRL